MRGHKMLEERLQATLAAEAELAGNLQQVPQIILSRETPMTCIPVVETGIGQWRMHGLFEPQVWTSGIKYLDSTWSAESISDLQRRGDGSSPFFRERLLRSLLSEEMQLKSVPASDVSAAQGDLQLLSLRQLLRLRCLHLHYTPGWPGG
jgi:hypothetical protein